MTKINNQTKELVELSLRAARSTIAVLDAMATRGAIKGEEMTAIGQLRDQCSQIIQTSEMIQSDWETETKK